MTKLLRPLTIFSFLFIVAFNAHPACAQAQAKLKIGFSIEAMNGERWQTDLSSFETRAKELGAEMISADAGGDDDRQLQQVQGMIEAGIKALVLLPHDTSKAARIVEAAKAANVKVISYDRLVLNSDVDLYITFDRVQIAEMQAESLLKRAPKGNYVLIAGSPKDEGAKILHDTQMKVLQPYIDRGEIKVIADGYTNEWLPSEAYISTLKAIDSSKGNIAAVLASNDGLAGGAIQALREHGLAGKVAVSGQDADLAAVICIAQGAQTMTVYKPVTNQALRAAEEAVHLAKGEKSNADTTINNGKTNVPTILLKPVVVTKDNIKTTVVKDGFQKLQSINQALSPDQQIK
ncbi:MAG TPA: substrate-binding domain-containing protein [Candidatus Dormibacteraeota bacterium]|nr:substrate-binding domain-containing protein [Candidatus Dormibacteraeota bacterium]